MTASPRPTNAMPMKTQREPLQSVPDDAEGALEFRVREFDQGFELDRKSTTPLFISDIPPTAIRLKTVIAKRTSITVSPRERLFMRMLVLPLRSDQIRQPSPHPGWISLDQ